MPYRQAKQLRFQQSKKTKERRIRQSGKGKKSRVSIGLCCLFHYDSLAFYSDLDRSLRTSEGELRVEDEF
jgi:hypothetical protein